MAPWSEHLRAIAEAKQRSQRPVIGWVNKIYNHELLRASERIIKRVIKATIEFRIGISFDSRSNQIFIISVRTIPY
jgi:hypothetical protein